MASICEQLIYYGDVSSLFGQVDSDNPNPFSLICPESINSLPKPPFGNYHQQGIQKTRQGAFVVSGSDKETGYIYLTDKERSIQTVIRPKRGNYNHLGGIQVADDILAVGYERFEKRAPGTSLILFYDVQDSSAPKDLPHLTVDRSEPYSTGGATALCRYHTGWLLLAANWDADRLDFYICPQEDLRNPKSRFEKKGSWSKKVDGFQAESVDDIWGSYQNINLFAAIDKGEFHLWFIGMHSDGPDKTTDWADLFRLEIKENRFSVRKVNRKQFTRSDNTARFNDSSGFYYNCETRQFEVYACDGHVQDGKSDCNRWG